jgi:hypothetical protein
MTRLSAWKMTCAIFVFCAATAIAAPAQIFNTLVSFNKTDGADPLGSFVQGADGNYYSTAAQGGLSSACSQNGGCGTVFKITAQGTLTTLYNFGANGFPGAGLTLANNGKFFGTTAFNGGTVFDMTPTGEVTTLYTLCTPPDLPGGRDAGSVVDPGDQRKLFRNNYVGWRSRSWGGFRDYP